MKSTLKNKNVIITGASSGIGKETARIFAKRGANIVLTARSMDKLETLRKEIGEYVNAIAVKTDVTKLKDCRNLVKTTIKEMGSADILINNAGYTCQGNLAEVDLKELERTIDVNLRGTVRLTKLFLPHILDSSDGKIINVSSLLGIIPLPTEAVYSSTKFAIRAFSYALAEELEETGVNVSVISPGPVHTPFIMDNLEKLHDLVLSPPVSNPSDIAEMILHTAQDGKIERIKPYHTGVLAKIGFMFPAIKKLVRPIMELQGRKKKNFYLNARK